MRKVFISNMLLAPLDREKQTYYLSDDIELHDKQFIFPLSYLVADAVQETDDVLVLTAVEQHDTNERNHAAENYMAFQEEIRQILQSHTGKLTFTEIPITSTFDGTTLTRFFKSVTDEIHDGDRLYCDVTFGMKPYSISMFVALAYGAKACQDVDVETVMYSMKYNGTVPQSVEGGYIPATIYDITNLYYLNALASNAKPGQKESFDSMLGFIMDE